MLIGAAASPPRVLAQEARQSGGDEPGMMGEDQMGDMRDEEARVRFRSGQALYEGGRFDLAAEEFEQAYRLSNRPALLYNAYIAWRDANDLEKAADALQRYLEQSTDVPGRVSLEARLATMREQVERERSREAEREDALARAAEAERRAAEQQPSQPEGGGLPGWVPWTVIGLGGATLVAGAIAGILTLSAQSSLEEDCPNQLCAVDYDLDGERDSIDSLALTTDILLGTGLVVAGIGAALFLFVEDGDATERPAATAACGPAGCFASVGGRF